MHIEQPTLPLSPAAFSAALRTGHGRAMQQIDAYGLGELAEPIIAACVSCLTYDPQCEANRAPWLFSIIDRTNLNAQVLHAIEATVPAPTTDNHRDLDHRTDIVKELAAAGSSEAKRMLYASLVRLSDSSDVVGAQAIVALAGMDGLIHVARQFGRWLQADSDFWAADMLVAQFDEAMGIKSGFLALERAAQVDPDVEKYLEYLEQIRSARAKQNTRFDPSAYTADQVLAHVKQKTQGYQWLRLWGAQASGDALETVFAALLESKEPEHVKRLFNCFAKRGIPQFDSRLLHWITDPNPDDGVRWAAVRAMASAQHTELRRVALRLIADGDMPNGIALLVNNFEVDDFALCSASLNRLTDDDDIHTACTQLLDLCQAHPGPAALECLLFVYERSPCSTCRKHAVKTLIETNTAPAWVLAESALDADPATRALVGADQPKNLSR